MPNFSFLILTYNSAKHIENLLNSLFQQYGDRIRKGEYEVIIVDNNSTDETASLIEKKFAQNVILVKNPENSGFAKGINLGVSKSKSPYVLFLNPDAQVIGGDIEKIISLFDKDEKAAIVGAKMLDWEGKNELSAGKFYTPLNTIFLALGLENVFGVRFSPSEERRVDFVSGGCMAVRKNIFEKLKGFDESFFMYIEDMELCYRVKKAGFNTYFNPGFTVKHLGQGSSDKSFAIVNIYKGLLHFHKKHSGIVVFYLIAFMLKSKAFALVILGNLINNKNIAGTYWKALKV